MHRPESRRERLLSAAREGDRGRNATIPNRAPDQSNGGTKPATRAPAHMDGVTKVPAVDGWQTTRPSLSFLSFAAPLLAVWIVFA